MDINNIPVIGRLNRSLNMIVLNFVILAIIFIGLGLAILFFPKVLDLLVASMLILAALSFLAIAYNIHSYKKKYSKWIE